MIIDFHTHIFPDHIAERAVASLIQKCRDNYCNTGVIVENHNDATKKGLQQYMCENNIDLSVVLPIVTKPSQFDSINSFAAQINNEENLISFGSVHPLCDDLCNKLEYIKSLGLKGIKLHPDYQGVFVDEPEFTVVVKHATQNGLITVLHAGVDGAYTDIHCPPDKASGLIDKVDSSLVVLAHTGGFRCWDGVLQHIAGKNVYMDISYTLPYIEKELFLRIVDKHGTDKLLFGTDSPWGDVTRDIELLRNMGFTQNELDNILFKNAQKLLEINL